MHLRKRKACVIKCSRQKWKIEKRHNCHKSRNPILITMCTIISDSLPAQTNLILSCFFLFMCRAHFSISSGQTSQNEFSICFSVPTDSRNRIDISTFVLCIHARWAFHVLSMICMVVIHNYNLVSDATLYGICKDHTHFMIFIIVFSSSSFYFTFGFVLLPSFLRRDHKQGIKQQVYEEQKPNRYENRTVAKKKKS